MTVTHKSTTLRPTRAIVDLAAIEHNLARIRGLVGEEVEILAVVKADAYGHGAVEVARLCARAGAAMLGVATVEEGAELRKAGIGLPILLQCCIGEAEIDAALESDLTLTAASREFAGKLSVKASRAGVTAAVHADIDTGMGRIGFASGAAVEEIAEVASLPHVKLDGIYTHLSTSEIEDDPFTLGQLELFGKAVTALSARGVRPPRIHAANSGAVINYPASHLSMVRPGLILYGVYPHESLRGKVDLRAALKLETSIVFLKDIPAGTPLGYGRTFVAPKRLKIATANVGYADGYPWRLSNKAKAIIRETLVPVVGRVSMDQLLLDVSHVPDAGLGDTVTLLGEDGSERISAEDMAEWAGSIPYEILCGISKRVPRQYTGETRARA
jgi:alanine racemase